MRGYRFSKKALEDLLNIIRYMLDRWGVEQAWKYRNALYECCALIGRSPEAGRACDVLSPGLRRMEEGKHVIFYRSIDSEVVISRILHQRALPQRRYFIDS